jgi:hypothetical protein
MTVCYRESNAFWILGWHRGLRRERIGIRERMRQVRSKKTRSEPVFSDK